MSGARAPLAPRWTRAQTIKNAAIAAVTRLALALLVPLPPRLLRVVGRVLGRLAEPLFPAARRIALANLSAAFPALTPPARRALLHQNYATLGAHLGDALASLDPRRPLSPLPVDAASLALLRAEAGGSGVLFVSAHLGPWERLAATLVANGVPMTVVAREAYDPRLSHVYDRLRRARGIDAIYRGAPGAPTRLVRILRGGRVLGVPMDLRSRVPSVASTFLGRPAFTAVGPARLALRTGARVIVGTVAPEGGPSAAPLCITCTEIPTSDLPAGPSGERALTLRIDAELSARIRALPHEWVWMHDRFALPDPVDSSGGWLIPQH
ncbi:MAG TPA: lysophospholipid acyltransferase family protein [Polyangiaceae bacterium]|jgi:KDO2-lipid IV(A) lauroyltransferase